MSRNITRRAFVGAAGAGLVGAGALSAAALGANEEIGVGLIGCGGRGKYLLNIFKKMPGVKMAAVCDVHSGRASEARELAGGKAAVYGDYRKLLADKFVDVVIVATTGHWHILPTIDACAAGKDVYTEKPVGTSVGEGLAAVKAVRKYKRIVQVGVQQHSWEHYQKAVEIVRSGMLGEISHVYVWDTDNFYPGMGSPADEPPPAELDWELYLGPAPKVAYNRNRFDHHYWFFDYGGAWQLDWAVHHYDIVHWAMGVHAPIAASGIGSKFAYPDSNIQWPDTFTGTCEYGPGPVSKKGFLMSYQSRAGNLQTEHSRPHGKQFFGSQGSLIVSRKGYQVFSQGKVKKVVEETVESPKNEHQVVADHVKMFLDCVRTRREPVANIELGQRATVPGHLMNVAWKLGRRVKWDGAKQEFVNDPEAAAMLTKKYREPWALPA